MSLRARAGRSHGNALSSSDKWLLKWVGWGASSRARVNCSRARVDCSRAGYSSSAPALSSSSVPGATIPTVAVDPTSHSTSSLLLTQEDNVESEKVRVFIDREDSPMVAVKKLLDVPLGQMHHLDIHLKSADVIRDCCKMRSREKMQKAQELLDRLIAEKHFVNSSQNQPPVLIAAKTFEIILFGWGRFAPKNPRLAMQRMKDVLNLMAKENEYDQSIMSEPSYAADDKRNSRDSCQPTVQTYNTVLQGLVMAAHRHSEAAAEAESLLVEMNDMRRSRGWHTKPNTRSYADVMMAHANTRDVRAGMNAERLLREMKKVHMQERDMYEQQHGMPYNLDHPRENARRIVTPDTRAYTAAILAHSNSGARGSADQAEALLTEMAQSETANPDAIAYGTVIGAWAKLAGKMGDPKLRFAAACRAEELAFILLDLVISANNNDLALETDNNDDEREWANQATLKDEEDDSVRENMTPSALTVAFNTALSAWARSDVRESAVRAEALLQTMLQSDHIQPDTISFNTVLKAWAKFAKFDQASPERAEELLGFMSEVQAQIGDTVKPDGYSYTATMSAWAKSNRPDKTQQARRLLDTMLEKHMSGETGLKPHATAFTTVLNAAAFTPAPAPDHENENEHDGFVEVDLDEPYAYALQCYKELLLDTHNLGVYPDHFAFAAMLHVIGIHTDKVSTERRQMVEQVFDDACHAGHVSALVIRALHQACPSKDLMERLLRNNKLVESISRIDELPKGWTRNVPREPNFRLLGKRSKSKSKKKKQS